MTFYDLNIIISGTCAAFTITVMMVFKQLHAIHLSNTSEQVFASGIMRISTLITMYSLISFLSVCFPTAEVYIDPWVSLVEGLAFCSFFLLLCDYVCPNINQRELFFATKKTSGVKWFRILFWVLTDIGVLKETDTLTFADLHIGIPNLLICIEMAPLSLFFLWVYSWRVYVKNSHGSYVTMDRPGQRPRLYHGGPIGVHAWLTMIKPSGIIESILVVSGRSGPPTDSLGQDDRVDNQPLNPNR
ncbi:hypothetical protein FOC4_g10010253 [Fusarium odoratissimum]|uniref:Uncharacterized protein n=1 Tax=Fusarium oxysporum f. sp. cubense (strain race 4) TaxID=2502994 RepID=N1S2A5_FUSC4|nr:hypothetical protein FOC4_g10010253 [Fusarium odoratissimum]